MKVETKTQAGELVTGAECRMTNDHGVLTVRSGDTVQVRRSMQDMHIVCKAPQNPDANALVISRVNGAMFGNILLGGGIGAIVDSHKGTAYTYPGWVQLVFGRALVFDRAAEKGGFPTPGVEPPSVNTPAPAPQPLSHAQSVACRWHTKDCPAQTPPPASPVAAPK